MGKDENAFYYLIKWKGT